jgi:hypothetical protein
VKTLKTVLLFFVFTMSFVAVGFCQNVKSLRYEREKIYLEYPSDWLVRNAEGYAILVSEPPTKEVTVMSTFDVQVDYLTHSVSEFCKKNEKELAMSQSFKFFKIASKKSIVFKGLEAVEYQCTAVAQSLPLEWRSIIFIKDGKVFKLTTTSIVDKYMLNQLKTNEIFESFRFE